MIYIPITLVWAGTAIFMDGLYSIILYLGKPSWRRASDIVHDEKTGITYTQVLEPFTEAPKEMQTWQKDHWVRVVRMLLALVVIGIGVLLV